MGLSLLLIEGLFTAHLRCCTLRAAFTLYYKVTGSRRYDHVRRHTMAHLQDSRVVSPCRACVGEPHARTVYSVCM